MAPRNTLLCCTVVLALGFLLEACTSTAEPWPPPGADYRGPSDLDAEDKDVWRRLDGAERTTPPQKPSPAPEEPWSLTQDLERVATDPPSPSVRSEEVRPEEVSGGETDEGDWTRLLEEAESGEARPPAGAPPTADSGTGASTPPKAGSEPPAGEEVEEPLSIVTVLGPGRREGPAATSEPSDPIEPSSSSEASVTAPAPEEATDPPDTPELPPDTPELSPAEIRERVQEVVQQLCGEEAVAKRAFRDLWEVPREWIPTLITEVENDRRTPLTEISVLVLDTKQFVRLDEVTGKLTYTIPGMGRFKYDDVAAGRIRQGKAIKAVFRDLDGFPVGVAVRAALVNRFRSTDFPDGDDRHDPRRWWQRFYERVTPRL